MALRPLRIRCTRLQHSTFPRLQEAHAERLRLQGSADPGFSVSVYDMIQVVSQLASIIWDPSNSRHSAILSFLNRVSASMDHPYPPHPHTSFLASIIHTPLPKREMSTFRNYTLSCASGFACQNFTIAPLHSLGALRYLVKKSGRPGSLVPDSDVI